MNLNKEAFINNFMKLVHIRGTVKLLATNYVCWKIHV